MEVSISVEKGILFLDSPSSVCSDGALSGSSIAFQGSINGANDALANLIYKVSVKISMT